MRVSYDRLWSLMHENKMKKRDLATAAQVSAYTMAKLGKNKFVAMDVMARFCKVFHCDIGDVMELQEDE